MKIKRSAVLALALFVAVAVTVAPGMAQHVGFQIGIAPGIHQPTVNPYVISNFSPWMTAPFVAAPAPVWFPTNQMAFPSTVLPFPSTFPAVQAPLVVTRSPFHQHGAFVATPGAVVVNAPPVPQAS